jgi:hypothetical protein
MILNDLTNAGVGLSPIPVVLTKYFASTVIGQSILWASAHIKTEGLNHGRN